MIYYVAHKQKIVLNYILNSTGASEMNIKLVSLLSSFISYYSSYGI